MNQSGFRHNYINPLVQVMTARDNVLVTLKRYCDGGNCHEAKEAYKEVIKLNRKIKKIISDTEIDILNTLPEVSNESVIAEALKDNKVKKSLREGK